MRERISFENTHHTNQCCINQQHLSLIHIFVYTPLVKEDEYIRQESNSLLKRYYNGNITSMLTSYIEDDKLSEEDIASLRNLLSNH